MPNGPNHRVYWSKKAEFNQKPLNKTISQTRSQFYLHSFWAIIVFRGTSVVLMMSEQIKELRPLPRCEDHFLKLGYLKLKAQSWILAPVPRQSGFIVYSSTTHSASVRFKSHPRLSTCFELKIRKNHKCLKFLIGGKSENYN